MRSKLHLFVAFSLLVTSCTFTSCIQAYTQSVGGDTAQVFERIFLTDFNTAWQAALDALKTSHLDVSNREGGYIQTKWIDNTVEKNFSDSIGSQNTYLKAQYRFRISIAGGMYNGRSGIKTSVQREQLVQRDVLEGWRPIESDTIEETTLLYRIGRIIYIRMKIAKLEEEKAKKEIENSKF